jgi:hypothetical protein
LKYPNLLRKCWWTCLGLFLGFSCFSVLLTLIHLCGKIKFQKLLESVSGIWKSTAWFGGLILGQRNVVLLPLKFVKKIIRIIRFYQNSSYQSVIKVWYWFRLELSSYDHFFRQASFLEQVGQQKNLLEAKTRSSIKFPYILAYMSNWKNIGKKMSKILKTYFIEHWQNFK